VTLAPFLMLTRKQMVQQMAIYDQLIVSIPLRVQNNPVTSQQNAG